MRGRRDQKNLVVPCLHSWLRNILHFLYVFEILEENLASYSTERIIPVGSLKICRLEKSSPENGEVIGYSLEKMNVP